MPWVLDFIRRLKWRLLLAVIIIFLPSGLIASHLSDKVDAAIAKAGYVVPDTLGVTEMANTMFYICVTPTVTVTVTPTWGIKKQ